MLSFSANQLCIIHFIGHVFGLDSVILTEIRLCAIHCQELHNSHQLVSPVTNFNVCIDPSRFLLLFWRAITCYISPLWTNIIGVTQNNLTKRLVAIRDLLSTGFVGSSNVTLSQDGKFFQFPPPVAPQLNGHAKYERFECFENVRIKLKT